MLTQNSKAIADSFELIMCDESYMPQFILMCATFAKFCISDMRYGF